MIELIIVMVVLGILAINTFPRLQRDARSEAINHMLQIIRYTQNLALHDNKYEDRLDGNSAKWQRKFWRFEIRRCPDTNKLYYNIGSDENKNGSISRNESAIDPSNGRFLFWPGNRNCKSDPQVLQQVSPNIFIEEKFGINRVVFSACPVYLANGTRNNNSSHIAFDYFGRVYKQNTFSLKPNNYGITTQDCSITFYFKDSSLQPFTIIIPNESGYAYLQENPKL